MSIVTRSRILYQSELAILRCDMFSIISSSLCSSQVNVCAGIMLEEVDGLLALATMIEKIRFCIQSIDIYPS